MLSFNNVSVVILCNAAFKFLHHSYEQCFAYSLLFSRVCCACLCHCGLLLACHCSAIKPHVLQLDFLLTCLFVSSPAVWWLSLFEAYCVHQMFKSMISDFCRIFMLWWCLSVCLHSFRLVICDRAQYWHALDSIYSFFWCLFTAFSDVFFYDIYSFFLTCFLRHLFLWQHLFLFLTEFVPFSDVLFTAFFWRVFDGIYSFFWRVWVFSVNVRYILWCMQQHAFLSPNSAPRTLTAC